MRVLQLLFVAALAAGALSTLPGLSAQTREVTGTFTVNTTVHTMTNVYAFARRNGLGEEQGLKLLVTSAPVPAEVIRGYINNSWIQDKALKGEIVALELLVFPEQLEKARAAGGFRNCCQTNFYAKGLITEDLSLSISGTQELSIAKADAGRIAGRVQLQTTKTTLGARATLQYDLTFNTKLLTSKSAFGPFAH